MARTISLTCGLLLVAAWLPGDPAKEITNTAGVRLRLIPAGKLRDVTFPRPFYLGVYEVTQEQYEKVVGSNPSWFRRGGGGKARVRGLDTATFPVEMASRDDAVAFCAKLSALPGEKKEGRSYRLPTEAEWEYACRAGATTEFHHGDRLSSDDANFHGYYPDGGAERSTYLGRTCRVGAYAANAWGLYDMHGNVWEWCSDWYDDSRTRGVLRGGSWYGAGRLCRASHRAAACPTERYHNIGFRVVCVVADPRE
jgi:formylglycine-generating enzyme required for sulfatase activity